MDNVQPKDSSSTVERLFINLSPLIIGIAAILLFFLIIRLNKTSQDVQVANAYSMVSNCILGKSANPPFMQHEIEACYIQVEKVTGVSLERFDEQLNNEN